MAAYALAGQSVYIVRQGDTLSGIAKENNLSVSALADRNGLSRNHHVMTGQRLVIFPSRNTATAGSTSGITYVVRRGDTLFDIAKAYNLSVKELARRNGIKPDYHVKVGERMTISPAGTTAAPAVIDTIYIVQRSDTLFEIAKANRLSVDELARRNGFDKDYQLKIGERLIIPATAGADSKTIGPSPPADLPATIRSSIRNAPVAQGRWKYIVIHHSGVNEGTVKGMDRYHRDVRHMENGLAYHFVIGNGNGMGNGEIAVGNRWPKQLDGGHLASLTQNKVAIGICLVGNFDKSAPSAAQMESLNALTRALMERCNISAGNVKTHQQINIVGTRCPGSKFPAKSFLSGLKTKPLAK